MDLHNALVAAAAENGFPQSAGVDIAPTPSFSFHIDRLDAWLKSGHAGEMSYLARGRDRRADPSLVFKSAKSVFCVLSPYAAKPAGANSPEEGSDRKSVV